MLFYSYLCMEGSDEKNSGEMCVSFGGSQFLFTYLSILSESFKFKFAKRRNLQDKERSEGE